MREFIKKCGSTLYFNISVNLILFGISIELNTNQFEIHTNWWFNQFIYGFSFNYDEMGIFIYLTHGQFDEETHWYPTSTITIKDTGLREELLEQFNRHEPKEEM